MISNSSHIHSSTFSNLPDEVIIKMFGYFNITQDKNLLESITEVSTNTLRYVSGILEENNKSLVQQINQLNIEIKQTFSRMTQVGKNLETEMEKFLFPLEPFEQKVFHCYAIFKEKMQLLDPLKERIASLKKHKLAQNNRNQNIISIYHECLTDNFLLNKQLNEFKENCKRINEIYQEICLQLNDRNLKVIVE